MRSTLIFRRIPESMYPKNVSKNLVNLLAHKLELDHYKLDLELSYIVEHIVRLSLILIKAAYQFMPTLLTGIMQMSSI